MADPSSSRPKPPDPPPPPPTPVAPSSKQAQHTAKDKGKKVIFASPEIPLVDTSVVHAENVQNISHQNVIPADNSILLLANTGTDINVNTTTKEHAMSIENRNAENVPASAKDANPSNKTSKCNDELQVVINGNILDTHMISHNNVSQNIGLRITEEPLGNHFANTENEEDESCTPIFNRFQTLSNMEEEEAHSQAHIPKASRPEDSDATLDLQLRSPSLEAQGDRTYQPGNGEHASRGHSS
ncbi:hypothetical protein Salat_1718700 [Sesamum alatum]|uniref:Uncharacterized protein n=1 Tax=Sesamum alatum TaxID=300844 RepID=A0AAE1Y8Z1_9LAMI|nr:hypothetical protein Salat_1718700 [Sesamum alatum]